MRESTGERASSISVDGAARKIVRLCGHLPLFVHICGQIVCDYEDLSWTTELPELQTREPQIADGTRTSTPEIMDGVPMPSSEEPSTEPPPPVTVMTSVTTIGVAFSALTSAIKGSICGGIECLAPSVSREHAC